MSGWEPGKPWTHPSITSLTGSELRQRLNEAEARKQDDERVFGDAADAGHAEAVALLASNAERVLTLRRAITERGGIA